MRKTTRHQACRAVHFRVMGTIGLEFHPLRDQRPLLCNRIPENVYCVYLLYIASLIFSITIWDGQIVHRIYKFYALVLHLHQHCTNIMKELWSALVYSNLFVIPSKHSLQRTYPIFGVLLNVRLIMFIVKSPNLWGRPLFQRPETLYDTIIC